MQLQLEDLDYQRQAIAAIVGCFEGQVRNTLENSNLFDIQANITDLTPEQILENKRRIAAENGVSEETAVLSTDPDICIEMETGTGKTLVYLRTAYELYLHYRHSKFIILVPSIAIKEGVLTSFEAFNTTAQLSKTLTWYTASEFCEIDVDSFQFCHSCLGMGTSCLGVLPLDAFESPSRFVQPVVSRLARQGQDVDEHVGSRADLANGDLGVFPPGAEASAEPRTGDSSR